ncbi:spore coat protein [Petroclostridium sp. X23]|uniref:spore coat protein n=1 Tax=Petroclostridium sp. X23 TaxID=3045146 RepID=UPI0024AE5F01|nr:spore coat protein [Petroclostridium sp. X23]WHH61096.1 spore coat protein [Petroclostridium sp. X23]
MSSFLGNRAKENMNLSDEVIAKNMVASATAAANAYLAALMTSTTPELRAVYGASLNQLIGGHSAIVELAVKREWGNPYIAPREQLSIVYDKVRSTMQHDQ